MATQNLNTRNPFGNPTKPGQGTKRPLKNPFANINVKQDESDDFQALNLNANKENRDALQSPFESKLQNQEKVFFGQPVSMQERKQPSASPLETTGGVVRRNSGLVAREDRREQGSYNTSHFEAGRSFQSGAGSIQQPFFTNPSAMADPTTSFTSGGQHEKVGGQIAPVYDEENEPPLLEDLGIDLELIKMRTLAVLKLTPLDERFARESDMSGPLLIALTFGSLLLLQGKIHFGYIYGFGVIGTFTVYLVMNLLSQFARARFYNTMSILGYCLLPLAILSFFGVFLDLQTWYGFIMCTGIIIWATIAATRFFTVLLDLEQKKVLVGYPILLFYAVFVLLTIF